MKNNKLKTAGILTIVFNAILILGYAALWFVLSFAVGLAKGFGGEGANVKNLDIVANISIALIFLCIIALIFAIIVLAKNKNLFKCKKLSVCLIVVLILKTILNAICVILILDLLSALFALVCVLDVVCAICLFCGIRKKLAPPLCRDL